TPHRDDPATQQWHLRRARRHAELSEVHALAQQGYSHHAIARRTGRHRRTIRAWLAQAIPQLSEQTREIAARAAAGGELPWRRRRCTPARQQRVQQLAQQGLAHSAIARITGLHRVTVSRWLKTAAASGATCAAGQEDGLEDSGPQDSASALPNADTPSAEDQEASAALEAEVTGSPPPAPWTSWEQVAEVREALKAH